MLGLPDFRVCQAREVDGEVELVVETRADRAWCRECGVRAQSHGRRQTLVRDVDAFDRRVRLRWRKRQVWRCPEPACPARTWTEQTDAIGPRASLTQRARRAACRRVGRDGQSVAAVARDLGAGWHTVMRAVFDHGYDVEQPAGGGVDQPGHVAGVAIAVGAQKRGLIHPQSADAGQTVGVVDQRAAGKRMHFLFGSDAVRYCLVPCPRR